MTNEDSWSFLTIGGGQIQTSAGQDDQVIATGGSSALAVETLTYQATATRNVESIHPAWDYLANESRNASYNKQIVSTTAFDPNDPDAVDPSPVITGDDRVIVTGSQWYMRLRKAAADPGTPRGNHFFAYANKDAIRNWLNPPPPAYQNNQEPLIHFKGYLPG